MPQLSSRRRCTLNWRPGERSLAVDAFWFEHDRGGPEFFAHWLDDAIAAWADLAPQTRARIRRSLPAASGDLEVLSYVLSDETHAALQRTYAADNPTHLRGRAKQISRARLGVEAALYRYQRLLVRHDLETLPDRSSMPLPRR